MAFATSAYLKARERERFYQISIMVETAVADQLEPIQPVVTQIAKRPNLTELLALTEQDIAASK